MSTEYLAPTGTRSPNRSTRNERVVRYPGPRYMRHSENFSFFYSRCASNRGPPSLGSKQEYTTFSTLTPPQHSPRYFRSFSCLLPHLLGSSARTEESLTSRGQRTHLQRPSLSWAMKTRKWRSAELRSQRTNKNSSECFVCETFQAQWLLHTPHFITKKKKFWILPTKCICVFRMTVQINNDFSYTTLIFIFPTETLCTSCDAKPDLYQMLMKFKF